MLGTVNSAPVEGAGAALVQTGDTVTFETDQSFTAWSTYNSTYQSGPTDAQWYFYYGSITSSNSCKINGSQSAEMRWYTSATANLGYAEMQYDLSNITTVEFTALYHQYALNLTVSESTDSGSTWSDGTLFELTSSATTYTYNVTNTTAETIRFRWALTLTSSNPSGTAHVAFDDVAFYQDITEPVVTVTAAENDWVSYEAGKTATLAAAVENFTGDVSYEWTVTEGTDLVSVDGEGNTAVVSALAASSGTATVSVTATDTADNTATGTIDIDVLPVYGVKEALANSDLLNTNILLGGYVVTENSGGSSYTRFQIADADISSSYVNGETSILLYDNSTGGTALVAYGQYVIVYGPYELYNSSTYEINSGYEVVVAENTVNRLVDFVMGSEEANQCEFKYDIAKAHYLAMTEADKETFQQGTDDDIIAARARYEAWASAIGDTNPYEATSSAIGLFSDSDSVTYALVAATIVLVLAVSAVAVYLTLKKRKEQAL